MLSVNGIAIPGESVAREIQHQPAESRDEAEHLAQTALVVRELLRQRVQALDIPGANDDQRIAALIDRELTVPEPTEAEIERYYRRNSLRFMSAPLYEAAHIFFPAHADDEAARSRALATARSVCAEAQRQPHRFGELARFHSACSSREQGGSLGQIGKGDTNPELELALATADEGSISLVRSRHGIHVLRLDRRTPGRQLPLEQVRAWIGDHQRAASKRRAIAQYLQLLAARADVRGIDLPATDGLLVQ